MDFIRLAEYQQLIAQPLTHQAASALRDRCGRVLSVDRNFETPGTFDLTATDWVGQIVAGDVCVVIDPKTPVHNLFYMLSYAYKLPRFQREPFTFGISDALLELVVLIFARQVENLVRRGIYRSYVAREENTPFLRGRLLINQQLSQNPVQLHRFFTRRDEFTADVLENRLLKAVIFLLSRLTYRDPNLPRRLRRLLRAFEHVSLQPITSHDFHRISYGRLNQHYVSLHNLARLLWDHLSLESYEGDQPFISYLLHMWRVFEVFTAEYLTDFFLQVPSIDVAVQQDLWLDADQRVKGVPDVVIKLHDRPALVLDTKYKNVHGQPPNADFYQMVTYCHRLGLARGILIYPGAARMTRTFNGISVHVLSLDLAGPLSIFRNRCRRFAQELQGLVTPANP